MDPDANPDLVGEEMFASSGVTTRIAMQFVQTLSPAVDGLLCFGGGPSPIPHAHSLISFSVCL